MQHVYEYCWPESCHGLHACTCMVYSVHAHVLFNTYKQVSSQPMNCISSIDLQFLYRSWI